jgi:hypothetical protein
MSILDTARAAANCFGTAVGIVKPQDDNQPIEETETDILKRCRDYYKEAKTAMESRRNKWRDHYKYYTNMIVPKKRPKYKSDVRMNYCWVVVEIKTPVMTQSKPTVNFVAFDPGQNDRADFASKLVGNALWNKLGIQDVLEDNIKNGEIYDNGYWKIGWDPSVDNGVGEIFVSSIDPFTFLPDPLAKTIQDARYVIHVVPKTVDYLKKKYPQFKDQIKTDKDISDILYEDRNWGDRELTVGGTYTSITKFKIERAYIKEYWTDASEEDLTIMETVRTENQTNEKPMEDDNGDPVTHPETGEPLTEMVQEQVEIQAPKYRYGRVITTINDDVVVDDKPNPYNHGKKPFVIHKVNKLPNEFFGIGDIEQIKPLQDGLNHTWQLMDDNATKTANIGWTIDPIVGEKTILALKEGLPKPGSLKVVPPGMLRPDETPQFPQYLIVLAQRYVDQIGTVSGITEILQGKDPHHRTAKGIERIFEAAVSRIGASTRLMEQALEDVAYMVFSCAQQFYTEQRTFALIGTSGTPTGQLTVNGPEDLAGEFDISVDSGASLPKDKQSKADLGFNLLQNHIFDMAVSGDPKQQLIAKTILNLVEFPGREELLNFKPPAPPPTPASVPPGAPASNGPAGAPSLPPQLMQMLAAGQGGAAQPAVPPTAPAPPPGPPMPTGPTGPTGPAGSLPPQVMELMQHLGAQNLPELIAKLGLQK